MAKDDFKNLGFDNGQTVNGNSKDGQGRAQGTEGKEKDTRPGELRW